MEIGCEYLLHLHSPFSDPTTIGNRILGLSVMLLMLVASSMKVVNTIFALNVGDYVASQAVHSLHVGKYVVFGHICPYPCFLVVLEVGNFNLQVESAKTSPLFGLISSALEAKKSSQLRRNISSRCIKEVNNLQRKFQVS
ncbi:unnamed protein product [Lactuca virosa]|uniref:Uncharacterized protein n=1 Tax=Lactuca virosa TaxID=75947 RepID=A0AAU9N2I4_9ASTR|nr:unnamed protein product [Lactuca virosa]